MHTDTPVILAGHGSRREESNDQVRAVAAALEDRLDERVEPAFIELTEPLVHEVLADLAPGADSVTVVPLSLFAAGHVKNDIPLFVQHARQAYPDVDFHYGANLGARPEMIDIVADRLSAAATGMDADPATDDVAVVFVGRGSSDPDANAEAYRLARFVWEGREYSRVEPAFIGITEPRVEPTLEAVSRHDPDGVIVHPYMLGEGVLTRRVRDIAAEFDGAHPGIEVATTDVLGVDDRLVRALEHRVLEARQGAVSMSCDRCVYKVTLEDYEEEVGGEQAFVDSLEHTLAHVSEAHSHDHEHGHGDGEGDGHSQGHGDGHEHGEGHGHSHGQ